jgi:4-carboxymuconolactone decarboxylase
MFRRTPLAWNNRILKMQPGSLGGRLPLLDPTELSETQRKVYDLANSTMVPWAEAAHFQSKTTDGKLIGPFNPVLFAPEMALCFADLQAAEARYTPLSERVRQVVILAVGAVWKADYELYAHSAVARKAGLSDAAIRSLARGANPEDLSDDERVAQRFVRQLTAEHHVEEPLYRAAEAAFGREGIVAMMFLAGCYQVVCSLLNAFEIPAPAQEASSAAE